MAANPATIKRIPAIFVRAPVPAVEQAGGGSSPACGLAEIVARRYLRQEHNDGLVLAFPK